MTVDDLAQEIRRIDGSHRMGAGALAEALMPFVSKYAAQAAPVRHPANPPSLRDCEPAFAVVNQGCGNMEFVDVSRQPAPVQEPVARFSRWGAKGESSEGYAVQFLKELPQDGALFYTAPQAQQPRKADLVGLKVSVDVSTGDHDAGNRLFGAVTGTLDTDPVTLLCDDARPNFEPRKAVKLSDTVTRLMELADSYANSFNQFVPQAEQCRQSLQDELTRLFTPLSDEQIKQACKEAWVFDTARQWVRNVEQAHGIAGVGQE